MFNNLNNANNQGHPEVDDIFAETDGNKTMAANVPGAHNSGIETRRVGLGADTIHREEAEEKAGGGKILKIVLILVIISIIGLGGYLVYSKFLNNEAALMPEANNQASAPANQVTENKAATSSASSSATGSVVTPASEKDQPAEIPSDQLDSDIPSIPGVNAPLEGSDSGNDIDVPSDNLNDTPPVMNVDSDLDGLTDAEEEAAGSNPNLIDSDNDGLSDYEEVKIYKTSPVNADTDGDGYMDGAEVKGGYNPNGSGKMPGSEA
jgi:hypothetical protein